MGTITAIFMALAIFLIPIVGLISIRDIDKDKE